MKDKKAIGCGLFIGIIFEISLCLGRLVTVGNLGNAGVLLLELILGIVGFSLLYHLLFRYSAKGEYEEYKKLDKRWYLLLIWGIMFLCYLPCYLSFFPGITSYDTERITEQAYGLRPFDNFQPFLHTIIWTACIRFEQYSGVALSAIVIYSIGQMLTLTGVFTYVLRYMVKNGINKVILFCTFLMYTFCPSIVLFSFITTKDILFGTSVLLLVLQMVELCRDAEAFMKSGRKLVLFTLTGIVSCLLRNNMIYVLMITAIVQPFVVRETWKRTVVTFLAIICGYFVISGPVYGAMGIQPGYAREMLSVPMSQLANVYQRAKDDIEPEDEQILLKFVPDIQKYERQFADPIKYTFNEEAYATDKGEFWRLWLKYLQQETIWYVDAFLVLNSPLWYMEDDTVDPYISLGLYGKPYIFEQTDHFPGIKAFYTDMAEYNIADDGIFRLPVIKQFFSVALPIWVILVALCALMVLKKIRWIMPILPLLLLWMTYLLGPVSNFRYMFPIIISYPIIVMVVLQNGVLEKKTPKGGQEEEIC